MTISLTEAAATHVKDYLERNQGLGLKLGVKPTGCSGWAYDVSVAHEVEADDREFESRGVKILVGPKTLPMVQGTEIDFVREGLNSTFVFRNPNVADECGCGESFTVAEGVE